MPESSPALAETAVSQVDSLCSNNTNILINTFTIGSGSPAFKSKTGAFKRSKPDMEKRRRARINASLAELRALIPDTVRKNNRKFSKLEKADILEMAVQYMRVLHGSNKERSQLSSKSYSLGYSECAQEVTQFLHTVPAPGCPATSQLKTKLLDHLSGCALHQTPDSPSRSHTTRDGSLSTVSSDQDLASSSLVARYLLSDPPIPSMPQTTSGTSDRKSQITPPAAVSSTSDDAKSKEILVQDNSRVNTGSLDVKNINSQVQRVQEELVLDDPMDITESPIPETSRERHSFTKKSPFNLRMTGNLSEIHHARRSLLADFEHVTTGQDALCGSSDVHQESSHQNDLSENNTLENQDGTKELRKELCELHNIGLMQDQDRDNKNIDPSNEEMSSYQEATLNHDTLNTQGISQQSNKKAEDGRKYNGQTKPALPHVQRKESVHLQDRVTQPIVDVGILLTPVEEKEKAGNTDDNRCNINTRLDAINGNSLYASNITTGNTNNHEEISNNQMHSETQDHNYFRRTTDTSGVYNISHEIEYSKALTSMSEQDSNRKVSDKRGEISIETFPTNSGYATPLKNNQQEISDIDNDNSFGNLLQDSSASVKEITKPDSCNTTVSQNNASRNSGAEGSTLPATQTPGVSASETPSTKTKEMPTVLPVTDAIQATQKPSHLNTIPSVLIPIFVQTSFGAGETRTFQQAFLINPSKDCGNVATLNCANRANNQTRRLTPIAPKLTQNTHQLVPPVSTTSLNLQAIDVRRLNQVFTPFPQCTSSKLDQVEVSPSNSFGNKVDKDETISNPLQDQDKHLCDTSQRACTDRVPDEMTQMSVLCNNQAKDQRYNINSKDGALFPAAGEESFTSTDKQGRESNEHFSPMLSKSHVYTGKSDCSNFQSQISPENLRKQETESNSSPVSCRNDHTTAGDLEKRLKPCHINRGQRTSFEPTRIRSNNDVLNLSRTPLTIKVPPLENSSTEIVVRGKDGYSHGIFEKPMVVAQCTDSQLHYDGLSVQGLRETSHCSTDLSCPKRCSSPPGSNRDEDREYPCDLTYLNRESTSTHPDSISNCPMNMTPARETVNSLGSKQAQIITGDSNIHYSFAQNKFSKKFKQTSIMHCPKSLSIDNLSSPIPRKRAYTISGEDISTHSIKSTQRKYKPDNDLKCTDTEPRTQTMHNTQSPDLDDGSHEDILTAALKCKGPVNREFLLARRRCASFSAPRQCAITPQELVNREAESRFYYKNDEARREENERQNSDDGENYRRINAESTTPRQRQIFNEAFKYNHSREVNIGDESAVLSPLNDICPKAQQNLDHAAFSFDSDERNQSVGQCEDMSDKIKFRFSPNHYRIPEDNTPSHKQISKTRYYSFSDLCGREFQMKPATQSIQNSVHSSWNTDMKTPDKNATVPTKAHQSRSNVSPCDPVSSVEQPLNLCVSSNNTMAPQTEIAEPLNLTTKKLKEAQHFDGSARIYNSKLYNGDRHRITWDQSFGSCVSHSQYHSDTNQSLLRLQDYRLPAQDTLYNTTNNTMQTQGRWSAESSEDQRERSHSMTSRMSCLNLDQSETSLHGVNYLDHRDMLGGFHESASGLGKDEENVWRPWSSCF